MYSGRTDDAEHHPSRKANARPMKHLQPARLGRPSPAKLVLELANRIKAISADQSGVAAIEFGIFAPLLFLVLANVVDVTMYLYQRMQVQNATEVAAQAAWKTGDLTPLPLTTAGSTFAASVTPVHSPSSSTPPVTPLPCLS